MREFASLSDMQPEIEACRKLERGRISAWADYGPRRRWLWIFGGGRSIETCFWLEWDSGIASLIFSDDAGSEYHACDDRYPVEADAEIRRAVAHGEYAPHPKDRCIRQDRAFVAVLEYLRTGSKPKTFRYIFVE